MSAPDALARCVAGEISPAVALAQLVLAGLAADEIGTLLPAGSEIAALFSAQRHNLSQMAEMIQGSGVDHGGHAAPGAALARVREMFDRAVAAAPEASVAAYSLGDPALLQMATREIVDWLHRTGLCAADCDVLDLGCGIGRVAGALAPLVRSVVGVDLSPGMIAEAQRRYVRGNLRFMVTDGRPEALPPGPFDLVLAVDSFPYLVQAGLADAHAAATAARLRPDGRLAVLNLSYRGDVTMDEADARAWAERFAWRLMYSGERPFTLWDGTAFVFGSGPFQRPQA